MTAPTLDAVTTAPEVDLNDDALVAAALSARMERQQHIFPDEPAADPAASNPPPKDAPAPDPATVAAPDGADSTTPAPDGAAPADPAPDPFAVLAQDAKPLGFRVNATDRTLDAILEVPGKGARIPADRLDEVRNMVARYESNADAVRQLLPRVQELDRLTHSRTDAQGQTETFHGVEAYQRLAEEHAALNQVGGIILPYLMNPDNLLSLLALDANNRVVPNQDALALLRDRVKLVDQQARFEAQREWGSRNQQHQQTAQDESVRLSAVPGYLAQAHPDLHAEDRAFLERRAATYLFTVAREQAAQYGQPAGTLMIDVDSLHADIAHLKAVRGAAQTTQVAATAAVKAAEKAAAENAKRNTAPVPPKAKSNAPPRDSETGQWTRPKRLSAAEIFDRSRSGESIGSTQLTE